MLDRMRSAPDADPVIERIACAPVAHTVAAAARTAGLLKLDPQYADTVQRSANDVPAIPLLLRPANAALDADTAEALVGLSLNFISALAEKSPAAEMVTRAEPFRLANWRGGAFLVTNKVALWLGEISITATVPRSAVEDCDMRMIGVALCESAVREMDSAFFTSVRDAVDPPGGILHRARSIPASVNSMQRDLGRLSDAVAKSFPRFLIGGPRQARSMRNGLVNDFMVRESGVLGGSVVAVAPDRLLAGLGRCRVSAKTLSSQQQVELAVHVVAALQVNAADAVAHVSDVEWGESEPQHTEPPPWAGLSEREAREIARAYCAALVRGDGEADKVLVARLRHYGCPPDQVVEWAGRIKAVPLGALTEEE
jgi:hypothetical protein